MAVAPIITTAAAAECYENKLGIETGKFWRAKKTCI